MRRLYKQWASSYDTDLEEFGYVAPVKGVSILLELLPDKKAVIHDAGCGTGQVGRLLAAAGYNTLHGSDFSLDMLSVARGCGHYQSLVQADYTKPLDFDSNSVDGIICIGVYTKRFQSNFIQEMLRILKAGGCMVFSCRSQYFDEVADIVKMLHVSGEVSKSSIIYDDYMTGQQASAYYVSFHKAV